MKLYELHEQLPVWGQALVGAGVGLVIFLVVTGTVEAIRAYVRHRNLKKVREVAAYVVAGVMTPQEAADWLMPGKTDPADEPVDEASDYGTLAVGVPDDLSTLPPESQFDEGTPESRLAHGLTESLSGIFRAVTGHEVMFIALVHTPGNPREVSAAVAGSGGAFPDAAILAATVHELARDLHENTGNINAANAARNRGGNQ